MLEDTDHRPKFKRRKDARPDEILDAALALFLDNGFGKTRMDDIAAEAGVSKGAVYVYFPSKDALIEALVDRSIGAIVGKVEELLAGYRGDPRPLLTRLANIALDKLSDPKALNVPELVLFGAASQPKLAQIYRERVISRILPAMTALFQQGIDGGHIRPLDPEMLVRCTLGPLVFHVLLADVFYITPAQGRDYHGLFQTHLELLFAGLEPIADG